MASWYAKRNQSPTILSNHSDSLTSRGPWAPTKSRMRLIGHSPRLRLEKNLHLAQAPTDRLRAVALDLRGEADHKLSNVVHNALSLRVIIAHPNVHDIIPVSILKSLKLS
jgi:hypothetical protein